MKKIDAYEAKKRIIEQIKITGMEQYDINKIMYSVIWRMEDLTPLQKCLRITAYLIFKTFHISFYKDHIETDKLAIELEGFEGFRNVQRLDNQTIYSNVYNFFKPCGHVLVYKKLKMDIKGLRNRFINFLKYMKQIYDMKIYDRAFVAVQFVMIQEFINCLENQKLFLHCKHLLIWEEISTLTNVIIQTAQLSGVKVVIPQHGMPMNRHEGFDQLFFDCFSADYKLCWNEATKLQFLSAGIDEEKLVVVGNTKKMYMPLVNRSQKKTYNALGVLLDGPHIDQGVETNKALIMIASKLATEFGLDCVVKLHPFDKKENYLLEIRSFVTNVSVLDASFTMEQYEEMVDFSLGHTTGAMLDLIYDSCFVFQYKTEIEFPIETDDIYIFHDYEELQKNYLDWKDNYEFYKSKYKSIINKYRVDNPIELHNTFFENLFQDVVQ